jgi:exopolyphosphatase/guanosine-5'-triphosphate,3'-diphosphate pyrophosphatase
MTRVAAVDCGTNSFRLLIADVVDGRLTDVVRTMTVVRLGQGVDKTGEFAADALDRTFAAADDAAAQCRAHGVEIIRFVATSATRDARNRQQFLDGVSERMGVVPEVISGHEEAALSFRGATSVLDASHDAPYLVVDLGGGSTEVVLGTHAPESSHSMDVGCVRMTERHLVSDPPEPDEIAAAVRDIHAAIDAAFEGVPVERTRTLVGLAGSITTVTAQALGLHAYDSNRINGAVLPIDAAMQACDELLHASHSSRAALGFMHAGRVDVIGAGALVWHTLMGRVRTAVHDAGGELPHVVTSEHDLLDGIAFSAAEIAK